MTNVDPLRLWDDNPSLIDLLGFDAVIAPIIAAIGTRGVDPLAIGVHSPWGGGKSTVLNLLEVELAKEQRYVVIRTDPWQYDDHDDVRGDLIVEVLDQLAEMFKDEAKVTNRVTDLVTRLSWTRIGLALGKGALTMQWNPDELVTAFTPRGRSDDRSMAGFKDEFAKLVDGLPAVERVIILVDDLDRCLPPAVMATLEAIKLFLAVPKMTFVIAADQDMVRDSIAVSLGETNRSGAFAVRYLEKIVQLPITLPRLAPADAEAYIGLLIAASDGAEPDDLRTLSAHCAARRRDGLTPLLGDLGELSRRPAEDSLALAAQLAEGLSSDRLANPRQIKRFLNAFGVRTAVTQARNVQVTPAVLMKLLLLEDLHRTSFETLAATPQSDRAALLSAWEAWGRGEEGSARPENVSDDTQHWAGSEPRLAILDLSLYLNLAATLLNVRSGEQASDAVIRLITDLLGEGEASREAALTQLLELSEPDQRAAMEFALKQGRRLPDVVVLYEMSIKWANQTRSLVDVVVTGAQEHLHRLDPGAVAAMGASPLRSEYLGVIGRLAGEDGIPDLVRNAARIEVEQANGN